MALKMQKSSGNVFLDIGFDPIEAEHLRIRSDLMSAVARVIADRKLTQARAAKLFGVTQPRISNLIHDRINLFSVDSLVCMLAKVGIRVDVSLRKHWRPDRRPRSA
jgi:predicted XRE-type DNA-binding protein